MTNPRPTATQAGPEAATDNHRIEPTRKETT